MTPQEACNLANALDGSGDQKVKAFLLAASAREIQAFIHCLDMQRRDYYREMARAALDIRLAEDAEITTRRIVWLTVGLLILTVALFAVEVRAVFFPQNPNTGAHQIQSSQHEQIFIPIVTNR